MFSEKLTRWQSVTCKHFCYNPTHHINNITSAKTSPYTAFVYNKQYKKAITMKQKLNKHMKFKGKLY